MVTVSSVSLVLHLIVPSSHKDTEQSERKYAGDLHDGAVSTKEDIGDIVLGVLATKDGHGSLLDTSEEARGGTRGGTRGTTGIELSMVIVVATWGGDHTETVLTQELDLTDLGSFNSDAQD